MQAIADELEGGEELCLRALALRRVVRDCLFGPDGRPLELWERDESRIQAVNLVNVTSGFIVTPAAAPVAAAGSGDRSWVAGRGAPARAPGDNRIFGSGSAIAQGLLDPMETGEVALAGSEVAGRILSLQAREWGVQRQAQPGSAIGELEPGDARAREQADRRQRWSRMYPEWAATCRIAHASFGKV